jgi:hypothetical protein
MIVIPLLKCPIQSLVFLIIFDGSFLANVVRKQLDLLIATSLARFKIFRDFLFIFQVNDILVTILNRIELTFVI